MGTQCQLEIEMRFLGEFVVGKQKTDVEGQAGRAGGDILASKLGTLR